MQAWCPVDAASTARKVACGLFAQIAELAERRMEMLKGGAAPRRIATSHRDLPRRAGEFAAGEGLIATSHAIVGKCATRAIAIACLWRFALRMRQGS